MTRSERTLAGVLGAAIVLAGGFQLARFYVIAPRTKLQADIARELADRKKLEDNLAPSARAVTNWRDRVAVTLGPNLEQARLAFRIDLADLLKRNNLSKELRIADKGATPFKKGPREGFVELPVNVTVRVRATNDNGFSGTAALTVYPGNDPPRLTSISPASSLRWQVGQSVGFSATGTDPQDGVLGPAAFDWALSIRHCPAVCHTHPLEQFRDRRSGSFRTPDHEFPSHLLDVNGTALVAETRIARDYKERVEPR